MIFKNSKILKYDIKIYYNIFSNTERKIILNNFKPYLTKIENHPGLQTFPNLHTIYNNKFDPFKKIKKITKINRNIKNSWLNYTDDHLKYEVWHTHSENDTYKYICCYMVENPESIGTWFYIDDKIYKPKCPTNSLIVFDKSLLHTVPPDVKEPRYTLAIDFY